MQNKILIKNSLLFTMQGKGLGVEENGAVYVEGKEITYVGPTKQLNPDRIDPNLVIEGKNTKAVLPGLIDGHLHSSETLFKGLAQDVPENEWMHKTVDPFASHLTHRFRLAGENSLTIKAGESPHSSV